MEENLPHALETWLRMIGLEENSHAPLFRRNARRLRLGLNKHHLAQLYRTEPRSWGAGGCVCVCVLKTEKISFLFFLNEKRKVEGGGMSTCRIPKSLRCVSRNGEASLALKVDYTP